MLQLGGGFRDLEVRILETKGGPMVILGLKGGKEAGQKMIESLTLFSHVANVGDAKSLAIHPATTTHSQMNAEQQAAAGVPPEMVRLSVGLEDPADLIADLDHALAAATSAKPPMMNPEAYLEKTDLHAKLSGAVAKVLKDQPEDPAKAIAVLLG